MRGHGTQQGAVNQEKKKNENKRIEIGFELKECPHVFKEEIETERGIMFSRLGKAGSKSPRPWGGLGNTNPACECACQNV